MPLVARFVRRVVVCGCFAAAATAGTWAVVSALGGPVDGVSAARATETFRTVSFGDRASVAVRLLPTGMTCYTIRDDSGTAHGCLKLNAIRIGYALSPAAIGGVAGANVHAVIVRLTRKGTVWADVRDGAFYARIPDAYRARAVVKVLTDGSRRTFRVTATR
jgi:hypothetical protein